MTDVDRQLARSAEVLNRSRERSDASRRMRRAGGRALRAGKISAIGVAAVLLVALGWGLAVGPIGFTGVMAVFLAMLAALVIGGLFSREADVPVEQLATADIKLLPRKTELWLDRQRPALPAPAVRLVDDIGVRLDALAPQLQTLDPREPAAAEIRRLIGEELPTLVSGYQRVPQSLRGSGPDAQLVEGLRVVESELARMTQQLAEGDLDKLATQGKYLELKYRGEEGFGA